MHGHHQRDQGPRHVLIPLSEAAGLAQTNSQACRTDSRDSRSKTSRSTANHLSPNGTWRAQKTFQQITAVTTFAGIRAALRKTDVRIRMKLPLGHPYAIWKAGLPLRVPRAFPTNLLPDFT